MNNEENDIIVKNLKYSNFVNLILAIIKIIMGMLGKSGSFIADGFHTFEIFLSDSCNIYNKKKNKNLYKINVIMGLVIIFIGFGVIYSSLHRTYHVPSKMLLVICSITIVIKLSLAFYMMKMGENYNNNELILSGFNSRLDVVSSIIVLITSSVAQFNKKLKILKYFDMIGMFIIGLLIVFAGYMFLKEVISSKIGLEEKNESLSDSISKIILNKKQVKEINKMNILKIGNCYKLVSDISMDGNLSLIDAHSISSKIERQIKKEIPKVRYITININPYKIKE